MKSSEHSVSLTVGKNLHCHFDVLRVENTLNSSWEIFTFLSIIRKFIEILKIYTLNKVTSLTIIRENPYFAEFMVLRNAIVQTNKVESVNWDKILLWTIRKSIFLLIIELKCWVEFSCCNWSDFNLDEIFLIFALI